MNKLEKSIDQIAQSIECQEQILTQVQSTKTYHVIEGVHSLLGTSDVFNAKGERISKSIKHMAGKIDSRIVETDALTTVKAYGEHVKAALDQIKYVYEYEYKVFLDNIKAVHQIEKNEVAVFGVMAPLESIDLPDGYSRRIKNIDDMFPDNCLKVYMSKDYTIDSVFPKVEKISEEYVSIKYNPEISEHCVWITLIAEKIGSVYIHSVYQSLESIDRSNRVIKFYDFHGVVPEELYYMGKQDESEKMNIEEEVLVKNANYIIVANEAMKKHLMGKYPECEAVFILFPMNSKDIDRVEQVEITKSFGTKPIVVYSGGLQKWQLISEMQDAMEKQNDRYDYRMYVSDKEEFFKLYGERKKPETWRIDTLSTEELRHEYEAADYGFILRDDIEINRVACPTKLIDYIKYGIIPIMKSEKIGDFVEKGLEYVRIEDFINGKMPSEEQRKAMVQKNIEVMERIYEEYDSGLLALNKYLFDRESKAR